MGGGGGGGGKACSLLFGLYSYVALNKLRLTFSGFSFWTGQYELVCGRSRSAVVDMCRTNLFPKNEIIKESKM